ncbi:MAG: Rid family detoxifying hydrolase [bacterium]
MPNPPISPFIAKNGFVFTSGQVYLTTKGKLLEGSVKEQAHQVMKNLEKVLTDAGVSFAEVVKTTIYVTDISIYGEVNEVYAMYFSGSYPAREVIGVKELPLGASIEISMVAVKE